MSEKHFNWQQIMNLASGHLRVALYTAEGEELERLQAAFPECYTTEEDPRFPIPLSVLNDVVQKKLREYIEPPSDGSLEFGRLDWQDTLKELNIPPAFQWGDTEAGHGKDGEVPPEVWNQLKGKPSGCGTVVEYKGESFIVTTNIRPNADDFLATNGVATELGSEYWITVVSTKHIDLDS